MNGSFDIKALKYEEVPNMQSAIEDYTVNVEEHLNKIKDYEIGSNEGVYGSSQIATVDGYIDDTALQINTIVRYFDDFKAKLEVVQEAYETKQGGIKVEDVEAAKEADEDDMVHVNPME